MESPGHQYVHFEHRENIKQELYIVQFGQMQTAPGYSFGPAVRDHALIHFIRSGHGKLVVNDKEHEIREGQLFYIPAGMSSFYQSDDREPWIYSYVGFSGVLADELIDAVGLTADTPIADIPDPAGLWNLLDRMKDNMSAQNGYLYLMSGLYQLMVLISDVTAYAMDISGEHFGPSSMDHLTNRVIALLEQDPAA